jgi:chromosome segregation ATPase
MWCVVVVVGAADKSEELHNAVARAQKSRRDADSESKHLSEELAKLHTQKTKLSKSRAAALSTKTKIELQWKEDQDRVGLDKESRTNAMEEIAALNKQIKAAQTELAKITPDLDGAYYTTPPHLTRAPASLTRLCACLFVCNSQNRRRE